MEASHAAYLLPGALKAKRLAGRDRKSVPPNKAMAVDFYRYLSQHGFIVLPDSLTMLTAPAPGNH